MRADSYGVIAIQHIYHKVGRGMLIAALGSFMLTQAEAAENFRARGAGTEAPVTSGGESTVSDVEAEVKFGQNIAARILGRYQLSENQALNEYVNLVGNGVALHAGRPELQYRFVVINSKDINAYAAPGGYVFVTQPAINAMRDEAELAGVLAHEVAHITRKHIVKALKIKGDDSSAQSGVSRFLSGVGDAGRAAFSQAIDQAVAILLEKGLEQKDELDADSTGTVYLATTGYDATALQRYLSRIKAMKADQLKIISTTHPPFNVRLKNLASQLVAMGLSRSNSPRAQKRFQRYARAGEH